MTIQNKTLPEIELRSVAPEERQAFCTRMQEAFAVAVIETFGALDDEKIPPDEDIRKAFDDPDCDVFQIVHGDRLAGGVVLKINRLTHRNSLDLFFISPGLHSKGLGLAAWRTIERKYPETLVWETCTPYFEKRNIHFYVNKCGFRIVKFFNKYYPDPSEKEPRKEGMPDFDFFVFEKNMDK